MIQDLMFQNQTSLKVEIIQRFIPFLPPEVVILPSLKNSIKTSSTIYFQTPIFKY